MLTLSVIVICLYLYPVCLVSRVLKNTYFKEQFSVVASKYRNLHYVQCLNIAPTEKAWICGILFYEVAIVMVKDKDRCTIKDTMSIKISFMQYRNNITWTRVMLPVLFQKFVMVLHFLARFYFSLSLSIGRRSTLAKIWRGCSPPLALSFLRAWIKLKIGVNVSHDYKNKFLP